MSDIRANEELNNSLLCGLKDAETGKGQFA
jgi:hypothetical protein